MSLPFIPEYVVIFYEGNRIIDTTIAETLEQAQEIGRNSGYRFSIHSINYSLRDD